MRSASSSSPPDDRRRALWRRAATLLVVVLVHILGVIGLIELAPDYIRMPKTEPNFTVLSLTEPKAAQKPSPAKSVSRTKVATPKTPTPPQEQPVPPLKMILMDSKLFSSTNIGALPQSAPAQVASADDSGAPGGKGEGPNGERLYPVEWYQRPRGNELDLFMNGRHPPAGAWGLVACRTIEGNRVEDCRELGESPGSGLARALRQAAGDFRVRAPRLGGRPMLGVWVGIRWDIVEGGEGRVTR